MKASLIRAIATSAIALLFSISFTYIAYAGTPVVVSSQTVSTESDGESYGGNIWIRSSTKIYKLTSGTTLSLEYTVPSTISGVIVGTTSQFGRIDIDSASGLMYFATSSSSVQRIWALDLNDIASGAKLVFMGLTSTQCDGVGGIAVVGTDLYFSCSSAAYSSKNALYRFALPVNGGAAKVTADLTTVATSTVLLGFNDLEYRPQDGKLFALMNHGWYGSTGYIVKIDPNSSLPAPLVTFKGAVTPGYDGIDIDAAGDIYYVVYANSSGVAAGYQVTQESPTVTASVFYTLTSSSTDYLQPGTVITDLGNTSSGSGVIAYFISGWGSIVKVTGTPPTSATTVNEVIVQVTTTTLALPGGTYIYRHSYTFTATSSAAGKVSFWFNGKSFRGCKNLSVSSGNSYTASCNFRPSVHGVYAIYASFVPSGNATPSTSVTKYFSVSARSSTR